MKELDNDRIVISMIVLLWMKPQMH